MKILKYVLITLCILSAVYWFDNRLYSFEANIFWKQEPFDSEKFKVAGDDVRMRMVSDIIGNQRFIGMSCSNVLETFGKRDGDYYHQDTNYTYQLTNKKSANWILTFIFNDECKVEKIFIRRSCCTIFHKII